ncbi:MAG: hypothetical protein WCZ23_17765 [Rhodospirillaceae bacterium]
MANPKTRSREDNITEMARLQNMYKRLPPDKQKAAHKHMQRRLDELQAAINGKKVKSGKGMGLMQTVLIVLLASVVAVALGFFGVTFLAKG